MQESTTFQPNQHSKQSIYVSRLDRRVLRSLADFLCEGLRQGDLCVAALTPRHRRVLSRLLAKKGIDINKALESEQLLTLAPHTLAHMLDFDGNFDETAYEAALEEVSHLAAWEDQRVRAFGELTGFKWPKLGSRIRLFVPQNQ